MNYILKQIGISEIVGFVYSFVRKCIVKVFPRETLSDLISSFEKLFGFVSKYCISPGFVKQKIKIPSRNLYRCCQILSENTLSGLSGNILSCFVRKYIVKFFKELYCQIMQGNILSVLSG
jgi:hypothetical protein